MYNIELSLVHTNLSNKFIYNNTTHYLITCNRNDILTISNNRCGDGLVDVLDSPEVQKYASNINCKVLFKDKIIYQHGALRKVL